MPEMVYALVRQATETPAVAEAAATYTLFILGLVLIFIVCAFFIHKKVTISKRKTKMDTSTSTTTMDGLIHAPGTNGSATKLNSAAITNGAGGDAGHATNGQHQNGAKNGASPSV